MKVKADLIDPMFCWLGQHSPIIYDDGYVECYNCDKKGTVTRMEDGEGGYFIRWNKANIKLKWPHAPERQTTTSTPGLENNPPTRERPY